MALPLLDASACLAYCSWQNTIMNPEIKGEDVDGKSFKLSDYRGKVVVIDFWGDW